MANSWNSASGSPACRESAGWWGDDPETHPSGTLCRAHGQNWSTLLKNHAQLVWACDSLLVIDLFFRQTYAFFIIELVSRQVVRFGVTSHPADAWVTQQARAATPYGQAPRFLTCNRDSRYGEAANDSRRQAQLKS